MKSTDPTRTMSRRSLVRGVAWTAPVALVAVSAPALAASPCDPASYTMPFTSATVTGRTGTATGTSLTARTTQVPGKDPVTATISAAAVGGKLLSQSQNLLPGDSQNSNAGNPLGGLAGMGRQGLQLQQNGGAAGRGSRQTVTVMFSRPVSQLSFWIVDIDSSGSNYIDNVALSGSPTVAPVATVTGTGTTSDPLRSTRTAEIPSEDSRGNAQVTFPGPLTSFTLDFWSQTGTAFQQIFITRMQFTADGCAAR